MSKTKVYTTIGASNHVLDERQNEDYYATDPNALTELLKYEKFTQIVHEIAVGGGHLAYELENNGYYVIGYDIIDRGYPDTIIQDFLKLKELECSGWDIITNPPYSLAKEFVEHSIDLIAENTKIAMFLKLTFLESTKRLELFKKHPPKTIYVFSKRVKCAKNGIFKDNESSAISYAWFVWVKGFKGDPVVKWI